MIRGWSDPLFVCTDCEKESETEWLKLVTGHELTGGWPLEPEKRKPPTDRIVGTLYDFGMLYLRSRNEAIIVCGRHPDSIMRLSMEELRVLERTHSIIARTRKPFQGYMKKVPVVT